MVIPALAQGYWTIDADGRDACQGFPLGMSSGKSETSCGRHKELSLLGLVHRIMRPRIP